MGRRRNRKMREQKTAAKGGWEKEYVEKEEKSLKKEKEEKMKDEKMEEEEKNEEEEQVGGIKARGRRMKLGGGTRRKR